MSTLPPSIEAIANQRRFRRRPKWWRDRSARRGPAVLVLTATIRPPSGIQHIIRTCPEERLADYKRALAYYRHLDRRIIDRIVFAENSLSPLDELKALVTARSMRSDKVVAFISTWGLDYPVEYNRGHGEFKLLDYVVHHSEILQALGPDDLFWKTTGRYMVANLSRVIGACPQRAKLYLDIRPWRRFVDVRCFASTVGAYGQYLENTYQLTRKMRTETVLFTHLAPNFGDEGFVGAMNVIPTFHGVAANTNQSYHVGREWWTHRVRLAARVLCPPLWY